MLATMKYKLTKYNKCMGKAKFTSSQIVDAILAAESGKKVGDICRELGVSSSTFYNWRSHKENYLKQAVKKLEEDTDQLVQARMVSY